MRLPSYFAVAIWTSEFIYNALHVFSQNLVILVEAINVVTPPNPAKSLNSCRDRKLEIYRSHPSLFASA